jgi:hypothetical protein
MVNGVQLSPRLARSQSLLRFFRNFFIEARSCNSKSLIEERSRLTAKTSHFACPVRVALSGIRVASKSKFLLQVFEWKL